jgi:ribosomal protein L33
LEYQNKWTEVNKLATKFCPHCGERNGFQVDFNTVCRIGSEREEKCYLRTCKDCGGRFITIQKDERMTGAKEEIPANGQ